MPQAGCRGIKFLTWQASLRPHSGRVYSCRRPQTKNDDLCHPLGTDHPAPQAQTTVCIRCGHRGLARAARDTGHRTSHASLAPSTPRPLCRPHRTFSASQTVVPCVPPHAAARPPLLRPRVPPPQTLPTRGRPTPSVTPHIDSRTTRTSDDSTTANSKPTLRSAHCHAHTHRTISSKHQSRIGAPHSPSCAGSTRERPCTPPSVSRGARTRRSPAPRRRSPRPTLRRARPAERSTRQVETRRPHDT